MFSSRPERRFVCGFVRGLVACGAALVALVSGAFAADPYPGIGRAATPKELQAWDIDVRPDFKGLPKGAGSVAQGQVVWEAKCASCHGIFGESGEVFNPIVGGTAKDDVRTGGAARLTDNAYVEAVRLLQKHRRSLDKVAAALLEKETLLRAELAELLGDVASESNASDRVGTPQALSLSD